MSVVDKILKSRLFWLRQRRRVSALLPLSVIALCLLLTPLISLLHQAVVLGIAVALNFAGSRGLFSGLAAAMGFDPVYASVLNGTLGNIEVRGVAIAAPLGDALHQAWPDLFGKSWRVIPGTWATGLVIDGASVLASALTTIGADVIFVALGLALMLVVLRRRGLPGRYPAVATLIVSVMLQARGAIGLMALSLSPSDLEVMGAAHIFTKLLPTGADEYRQLMDDPVLMSVAASATTLLLVFTYGPLAALCLLRDRPWTSGAVSLSGIIRSVRDYLCLWLKRIVNLRPALASLVVAVVSFQAIVPDAVDYNYVSQPEETHAEEEQAAVPTATPQPTQVAVEKTATPTPKPPSRPTEPSKVFIEGADYAYTYTVNGQPERMRGVGYNAMRSSMSRAERVARYDRDFAQMKAAGVNTILGWDEWEFDEVLLEKAQEYGLGVIVPFDLPPAGDYSDPEYTAELERRVTRWVWRNMKYPAVRMWGIGNEVIHGMAGAQARQARAFGRFLVRVADTVHAIDPNHPVIYRDAEDVNFHPVTKALKEDEQRRPWFIYGVNIFTYRIDEVFEQWPQNGPDMPIVVSEFAPSGLGREDRPTGYARMWRSITKYPDLVLGGFAYVWSIRGPEPVDMVMGLVNEDGSPSDGSLAALGRAFRRDAAKKRE